MKQKNNINKKENIRFSIYKIHDQLDELINDLINTYPENEEINSLYKEFQNICTKNISIWLIFDLLEKICVVTKKIKNESEQGDKEFLLSILENIKILDFNLLKNLEISEEQKIAMKSLEGGVNKDISEIENIGNSEEQDIKVFKEKILDNAASIKNKLNGFIIDQSELMNQQSENIKSQNTLINSMKDEMQIIQDKLDKSIEESYIDTLTGIQNRKSFENKTKELDDIWKKENSNIFLVIIDIDHFKKINDSYGHYIGDQVLIHMGKFFKKVEDFQKNSKCFRYGGEEFVISIRDLNHNDVIRFVKKMKKAISNNSFKHEDIEINVSVSIGVSYFGNNNNTSVDVFNIADKALYKAKEKRDSIYVLSSQESKVHFVK